MTNATYTIHCPCGATHAAAVSPLHRLDLAAQQAQALGWRLGVVGGDWLPQRGHWRVRGVGRCPGCAARAERGQAA